MSVKPEQILQWTQVGLQLITVLGVPISQVVAFFRAQGVGDADLATMEILWQGVIQQIEGRMAQLKAGQ